jgi:hypothetical protein
MGVMQSNPAIAITKTGETRKIPMYMITTREKLNYEGIEGLDYGNSYPFLNISQLT